MPRKTKEQTELENKTTKKATSKSTTKKTVAKKVAKTEAKKDTATKKKTASTKKATTTKKKTSSTASAKKTTKKTSTKKSTAKKTTKKSTTKKKTTTSRKKTTSKKKVEIVEYYDLPYRYNQTIVKVLAQTPTTLFVYWDISDKDRNLFKEKYGENFFEITDDKEKIAKLLSENLLTVCIGPITAKVLKKYNVTYIHPDTYTVPDMMELLFEKWRDIHG